MATLIFVGDQDVQTGATDDHRARLNERLRQAFLEGAEEHSRYWLRRGLTAGELERVLRSYPGDVTERRRLEQLTARGKTG